MKSKILLIYTGGTIGMGRNHTTGALEPLDFGNLLSQMPEFRYINADVETYQFRPIDSSDVSPELWVELVKLISENYDKYDGFVILHGTDTMAYTASALSFMLENLTKPVILTGSQLPMGILRTDGKENLITSIELAADKNEDGTPRVPEVCVYFSGRLIRGNRSTKKNADGFQAFDSYNFPHLCDAGVDFVYHPHNILKPDFTKPMTPHLKMHPDIVVFSLFPGIQENIMHHMLSSKDLVGIVMRTYGSGNAPQYPWLTNLLHKATARGVVIVNVTQCGAGRVEMSRYSAGHHLKEAGVISGYDGTVEATVTKLMYLCGRYEDPEMVRKLMNTDICGEITV